MKRREFLTGLGMGAASAAMLAAPRAAATGIAPRATGDLGIVIERATGSVLIVNTTRHETIGRIEGLGDISHASASFSRCERYAYVFGRDGGLSKLDLLEGVIARRIVQSGNAIGGAISDDGKYVAASNYEPGGVRVFDSETLELVADIPATYGEAGARSKVIGLVDAPGQRFVFSLWDAGETWIADFSGGATPRITKIPGIGKNPYDALITSDGRHYIAGLFGEDGLTHVDLWRDKPEARRILSGYGRGEQPLPVYKMPHLQGWAKAGDAFYLPAIGRHEVLVMGAQDFQEQRRIAVAGQPVFAMSRPDGRHVYVNFAPPDNAKVQIIDTLSGEVIRTLEPGPGVLHMEFAPRGAQVWMSVRDADEVQVWSTARMEKVASLKARKPSGIFFTARAHRAGL
jgi:protein NirF